MSIAAPTTFTTNLLIADSLTTPTGTEVQSTTASCGIELQSTSTAFTFSRLTGTQITAIATPTNGMIVYNTTTNLFNYYVNGAWTANGNAGALVVPGVTTATAIALWGDGAGGSLTNSVVLVSGTGAMTGITGVTNGNGVVATPSFNFTASTGTGMWSSALNTVDFSTNGLEALQLLPVVAAVNWLAVSPSATTTPVLLSALGTDVNIGIRLVAKGTGGVQMPVGAVATPSVTFTGNVNTGMWRSAANTIDFSTNGLEALQILPVAAAVNWVAVSPSATTTPVLLSALGADNNISMQLVPKGTGAVIVPAGLAATPSLVFAGDTTTGIYDVAAGTLGISVSGALVSAVSAKGIGFGTAAPTNAATNTISIPTGTAPSGVSATTLAVYAATATGALTTLGMFSSSNIVSATGGGLTPDHNFAIVINGTTYYVPCKTTQT